MEEDRGDHSEKDDDESSGHQSEIDEPLKQDDTFVAAITNDWSLANFAIECEPDVELSIAGIQAEAHQPGSWDDSQPLAHIEDARLMKCKPDKGKANLIGKAKLTSVLINNST
ncbi:hypothetical protein PSTG_07279 [Puccinia striiformis f. sp. tritici PST-78]|uniref:Uncharacterized protein n=1 Tax=Puccinia striiformis f. sp. tritici PST-78 TaxID=1165861 RepID=A0A0L0VJW5_9BASI|nr:hypothetical protein PSTG_07279 [Puccinia striiformis f. sp. tritici PST-78]